MKQIAPTYSVWDLATLPPHSYMQGAYHYVIKERTDTKSLIDECETVMDFGVRYRVKDPDDPKRWSAESVAAVSEAHRIAKQECDKLNRGSFAAHIAGRFFDRYVIPGRYVTLSSDEAVRLAQISNVPMDKVQVTRSLHIQHVAGSFIYWGDGKLTTAIGTHLPQGGILSSDAVSLISICRGSDSGTVHLPGGMYALTRIKSIKSEEDIAVGPSRGHYARETVKKWVVDWKDGYEGAFYSISAGYFEGYAFDIYPDLETLKAHMTPAPDPQVGITEFPPDDFDYDPQLGYVAKQQDA